MCFKYKVSFASIKSNSSEEQEGSEHRKSDDRKAELEVSAPECRSPRLLVFSPFREGKQEHCSVPAGRDSRCFAPAVPPGPHL